MRDCFVLLCTRFQSIADHTLLVKMVKCRVLLLDGTEFTCDVNVSMHLLVFPHFLVICVNIVHIAVYVCNVCYKLAELDK